MWYAELVPELKERNLGSWHETLVRFIEDKRCCKVDTEAVVDVDEYPLDAADDILDDAERHGLEVGRIVVGGGGAKSALWLQVHADVLQRPITLTREPESCALGAAMAAAVGAGLFPDFDAAAAAMVATERVVEPDPSLRGVYDELFARYVDLYAALNGS